MICPISADLSLSRPQLYHHLRTRSQDIPLYLSMPWSRVNTEYSIHRVQHTPSAAYTYYNIQWVMHIPRTASFHDRLSPARSQSLGRPCTQFSTFPQLQVNQWIETQLPSRLPPELPPPDWLPPITPPILRYYGLQVHLQTRSITASKFISKLAWLRPASASANSLNHGVQVYL